jgi:long-chain acyl-CoA synthetase
VPAETSDDAPDRADLATALGRTAARLPDQRAIVWRDRTITYGELDRRVDAAASALRSLGVEHGDRVALLLGNTPAFVEAYLGVLRAGATVVPMNPGLTGREVAHIVGDCSPRVLIAAAERWRAVAEIAVDDHRPEAVVTAGGETALPGATATWSALLDQAVEDGAVEDGSGEVERQPEDIAALVYTSGTTAHPRGAMLTRRNLAANQDQVLATRVGLRGDDTVLLVLPLFHIYALNVGLGSAVRVGATLLLQEDFDPVGTIEDLVRERVTVILGAPPMYVAWLNSPEAVDADLSAVRAATSGAAPLSAQVLTRAREELGLVIWEGYGLTEAGPAVTSTAMGDDPRPGSVGLPLPGVEIRLVDGRGRDVELGDPGEVWVRGENVFAGYWEDEEATRDVLDAEGWLHTGDVGIRDDEGYLYLVDRSKDLIIVAGFNVYPAEVEEVLREHPEIADVAVIGAGHPYRGEAVKAFVVPSDGASLDEDEVNAWARERLARYKCPSVVAFVDALPYTATGKLRRVELREGAGRGEG